MENLHLISWGQDFHAKEREARMPRSDLKMGKSPSSKSIIVPSKSSRKKHFSQIKLK